MADKIKRKFPSWLRKVVPATSTDRTINILASQRIHTICESARCPNKSECFSQKKATFLILGNICTRSCAFCSVRQGVPLPVDSTEARRIAHGAFQLGLKHVVITSVTRDDLRDGGANHFALTVQALEDRLPDASVEVLTPDFEGFSASLDIVCKSGIDIFNHNLETARRLYPTVRPEGDYERSLSVLQYVRDAYPHVLIKSGIMVGLGENDHEVVEVLDDLHEVGCDIVTIGQYLQPCMRKRNVERFVIPQLFSTYADYAKKIGIRFISSGPFVRSSYNAEAVYEAVQTGGSVL